MQEGLTLFLLGTTLTSWFYRAITQNWTLTVTRWPQTRHKFSHRACHLLRPQQPITVYVYTFRSNSGRELMKPCQRKNGGGNPLRDCLVPVMTHLPPAPDALLRVIRCNCSTDCSSLRCSCRRNNRSAACGQCKGTAGTNSVRWIWKL